MAEYYAKFRRGDMNLDDKLEETEFLYFEHPEHNPQSIKDLVEDMISNFDKNQDKVCQSCSQLENSTCNFTKLHCTLKYSCVSWVLKFAL